MRPENNNNNNPKDVNINCDISNDHEDLLTWNDYHNVLEDWNSDLLANFGQSSTSMDVSSNQDSKGTPVAANISQFKISIPMKHPLINDSQRKKVSDAVIYGPRFCALFEAYKSSLNIEVNSSKHLLTLCLEHMIPFVKWMRESDQQIQWVNNTLLDHDYLRCEVRNGAVIILTYVFASIKVRGIDGMDMFLALQDQDTGFGIANRFSLKVYNDPFNFLMFLKSTLSALIDAGAIPDNERVNQPKKSKQQVQNKEELQAFAQIQNMIRGNLDNGNVIAARNIIQNILVHWQFRGKYMRHRRFLGALQMLRTKANEINNNSNSNNNSMMMVNNEQLREQVRQRDGNDSDSGGESDNDDMMSTENSEMLGLKRSYEEAHSQYSNSPLPDHSSMGNMDDMGYISSNQSSKRTTFVNKFQVDSMTEKAQQMAIATALEQLDTSINGNGSGVPPTINTPSTPKRQGISALRFERINPQEWEIKETKIFDLDTFVSMYLSLQSTTPLLLIDESRLQSELSIMRLDSNNHSDMMSSESSDCNTTATATTTRGRRKSGIMSLEHELRRRKGLVASWPIQEIEQFKDFVSAWEEQGQQGPGQGQGQGRTGNDNRFDELPASRETGKGRSRSITKNLYQPDTPIAANTTNNNTTNNPMNLINFWRQQHSHQSQDTNTNTNNTNTNPDDRNVLLQQLQQQLQLGRGFLAYELVVQVGILVRANESIGLREDMWCKIYPSELHALEEDTTGGSFGSFLQDLFPQLYVLDRVQGQQGQGQKCIITLKYFAHKMDTIYNNNNNNNNNHNHSNMINNNISSSTASGNNDNQSITSTTISTTISTSTSTTQTIIPTRAPSYSYQTIGTMHAPMKRVLQRLHQGQLFHDFILEIV